MLNSTVLDVVVGIVLVYLVLSVIVTSVNEFIAQFVSLRAENLVEAIHGMFPGEDRHRFAEDILNHSTIAGVSRKQFGVNVSRVGDAVGEITKYPSAIAGDIFAKAVLDLRATPKDGPYDPETMAPIDALVAPLNGVREAEIAEIAAWFDGAMDRIRGWYKRKAQVMSFAVAFALAILVNADSILVIDRLSNDTVKRAELTAYAKRVEAAGTMYGETVADIQAPVMNFLGWEASDSPGPRRLPTDRDGWLIKLAGLTITAFAAALGAPFWFDILSKVMTVRSGGDPKEKKEPGK